MNLQKGTHIHAFYGFLTTMAVLGFFLDKTDGDRFNVGDCIAYVYPGNEFEPAKLSKLVRQIIKKGKEGYVVTYNNGYLNDEYLSFRSAESHEKTDCLRQGALKK